MSSLAGKNALVIGASSEQGLGAAIANSLKDAGARVCIAARRKAALDSVAKALQVAAYPCDVTDQDSIDGLFEYTKSELGALDVAVFAVGANHFSPLASLDLEKARPVVETQLFGALRFLQGVAPQMNDHGSVIMVSSLTARRPAVGTSVYAGTKAAVEQITRVAALEWAERGVRVNGIAPGMMRTEMTDAMFGNPNLEPAVTREIPLGRLGRNQEIAAAALWLANPDCFMTGETLPVSGGAELKRIPTFEEIMG